MSNLSMVEAKLPPGFRFHPRDEELVCDYLMKKVTSSHGCPLLIQVNLNKCEPWDLPEMACVGGKEWYFYSQRDRKYATGLRTNRATVSGYWKATGKDRPVMRRGALVGMRKTLVFYHGRAPKGRKTNWVMHEFRLEGPLGPPLTSSLKEQEDWVLCRMFCKNREVTGKQGMSRSSYDDTSSSSLLPPLMDSYINFDQTQSTSIPNECEQVPCFSISTIPNPNQNQNQNQNQINPTFSHSNIIDHLVDPKLLLLPTKTPVTTTKSLSTFDGSAAMVPDLGARLSSFSCENTVLKAVLNHLTEMEINNPSIKGSPSFREGCSESFLSDLGFPTFWNQY